MSLLHVEIVVSKLPLFFGSSFEYRILKPKLDFLNFFVFFFFY